MSAFLVLIQCNRSAPRVLNEAKRQENAQAHWLR